MTLIGCLPFIFIACIAIVVILLGNIFRIFGYTLQYFWDSLCNLFRSKNNQKETYNPFADNRQQQQRSNHNRPFNRAYNTNDDESQDGESQQHTKIFDANDGEYIDFEEIKDK